MKVFIKFVFESTFLELVLKKWRRRIEKKLKLTAHLA